VAVNCSIARDRQLQKLCHQRCHGPHRSLVQRRMTVRRLNKARATGFRKRKSFADTRQSSHVFIFISRKFHCRSTPGAPFRPPSGAGVRCGHVFQITRKREAKQLVMRRTRVQKQRPWILREARSRGGEQQPQRQY